MEEIGARVTMLTLDNLQGSCLPFLTWLLERCKPAEVALTDIFTDEAMTMLIERLTTPLQLIHYAWRALEEAYVIGQSRSMSRRSKKSWPRIWMGWSLV
jgi:hypothetical protein